MVEVSYKSVMEYLHSNPHVAIAIVVTAVLLVMTPVALQFVLGGKSSRKQPALDRVTFKKFALSEKIRVSHNTRIFRFALDHPDQKLGLPLGRHISLRVTVDGKEVIRPYTPISSEDDSGYFDLLIKVYPEPHGVMSRHLDSLKIGDTIDVRGPSGKYEYAPNSKKMLGMIAGGTGLTPMWQVFQAILKDPNDKTKISLIFANVTEADILLKKNLDQLQKDHPDRFSVYYVLNEPPKDWTGGVGFVTEQLIRDKVGLPAGNDKSILLCGPPPMIQAMRQHLGKIGYADTEIFKF
mmetsp:Transcript_4775/g.8799  ORF Transcript_4775/g.8799 Transcript_4775/m.8799 type:complete len:294 (-) Transcript_4775:213-1094(-)|eukprot:CAMPEP_0184694916 /NCGR_PEP_ID=MMETSP0313-20130426/2718_1 /TAXON_ID=2792 /ORGANISM="Porphyridium aerugineum, Strain SAG 1380-2" /LENGTH=293 /DNA_ID=CAMNT_0027153281 /DNA_START=71 /DNA_END=952 /DNA_ORIENTATION=-